MQGPPLSIRVPKKINAKERETQEEINNMNAVTVNINSPNWNIPYGNEPNRGKTLFQLTSPSAIKATPKSLPKTRKNRKTRKTRRSRTKA